MLVAWSQEMSQVGRQINLFASRHESEEGPHGY
jgi:hypothetical protein